MIDPTPFELAALAMLIKIAKETPGYMTDETALSEASFLYLQAAELIERLPKKP